MNATQLIARKRDGHALNDDELGWLIAGYVRGDIPDYQMSAFAMAVYLRGMSVRETAALTRHMLDSGVTLMWPQDGVPRVDKHSTGGIGDKISLILAPLLACCGIQVPMISGRGLGPTGGTLDKLEAIPGFRTDLSIDELQRITQSVGCVIAGATQDLVPADRQLYALRDVTATVSCIPLITASIMSKKLAEGLDALVLDVKHGSGAFMKSAELGRSLAEALVRVGRELRLRTTALLTDMNQPLGGMIGNAVEVQESLDSLSGDGPQDVRELTLALGSELLLAAGRSTSPIAAREELASHLDSGRARERFEQMVAAQGGDLRGPLRVAPESLVCAHHSGVVQAVNAELLGYAIIELGGGRKVQADRIDHTVGLEMLVRIGDDVSAGQPLLRVFAKPDAAAQVLAMVEAAITIGDESPTAPPLILERIGGDAWTHND